MQRFLLPNSSSLSSASLGFSCLKLLSSSSLEVIYVIYSWIFIVLSLIVALTLCCPLPPSFCLVYSLRVLDLGQNPPCITRSIA